MVMFNGEKGWNRAVAFMAGGALDDTRGYERVRGAVIKFSSWLRTTMVTKSARGEINLTCTVDGLLTVVLGEGYTEAGKVILTAQLPLPPIVEEVA